MDDETILMKRKLRFKIANILKEINQAKSMSEVLKINCYFSNEKEENTEE